MEKTYLFAVIRIGKDVKVATVEKSFWEKNHCLREDSDEDFKEFVKNSLPGWTDEGSGVLIAPDELSTVATVKAKLEEVPGMMFSKELKQRLKSSKYG